jgi:hypothetical protein
MRTKLLPTYMAGLALFVAGPALAGLLPGLGGPPAFEVFAVDANGGGWIIHHMMGRGDTLWGCKDVTNVTECVQVYFEDWKPASKMSFIHVTDTSQRGWLKLSVPVLGDYLFACSDPEGTPACARVDLDLRPALASFSRTWPAYDCKPECTAGTNCESATLPTTDARRVIETAEKGDMLLQLGIVPGPSNLYACRNLESAPACELTIPNWLAFDRQDIGLSKLANVEDDDSNVLPGALVDVVDEESAAAAAGLKEGDQITAIGGLTVRNAAHARYLLLQYPADQTVTITLDGGRTVDVKISRKPRKEK